MLPLGRERKILGDHGPAIPQRSYTVLSSIEHWLDCEDHARFQSHAFTGVAIMTDLWLIVVNHANAMSTVVTHYAIPFTVRHGLNGVTDITERGTRAYCMNAGTHRLIGRVHQPTSLCAWLADKIHAACITEPTILEHRNINIEDIAIREFFI
ncbi:hypothetical protein D3C73_1182290 [compost metagenome]